MSFFILLASAVFVRLKICQRNRKQTHANPCFNIFERKKANIWLFSSFASIILFILLQFVACTSIAIIVATFFVEECFGICIQFPLHYILWPVLVHITDTFNRYTRARRLWETKFSTFCFMLKEFNNFWIRQRVFSSENQKSAYFGSTTFHRKM